MRRLILLCSLGLLGLLTGCGDDAAGDDDDDVTPADGGPTSSPYCDALGLPTRAFQPGGTGTGWGDLAGDFTVETLDGPWTLSEEWTGCDSYLFVLDIQEGGLGDELFTSRESIPEAFFERSPDNVHYFFLTELSGGAATTRLEGLRSRFEVILDDVVQPTPEERARWMERLHFVTTAVGALPGNLGEMVRARPRLSLDYLEAPADAQRNLVAFLEQSGRTRFHQAAFAIDRLQRLDPVGHLSPFAIGRALDLNAAAYAPNFYNYRAALEARVLAEEGSVTVVPLVDETGTDERILVRTATLPDAATMAGFDTLEADISVLCRNEFVNCSEWDRNAYLRLCDDAECASTQELVRWITPYWRPGERRWLMDASPLLGLLADGGEQTFQVVFGPGWERKTVRDLKVSLRLSSQGRADRAFAVERAFTGGSFGPDYNDAHPPFTFTPPEGTTRVEIVTILSGHGQNPVTNCAEWCDHRHELRVNEGDVLDIRHQGAVGSATGCGGPVGDGVVPGQFGNWAPERAYWCPGWPVAPIRHDVTAAVDLAGENVLAYEANLAGGPIPAPREGEGPGNIDLSVYVAYYR